MKWTPGRLMLLFAQIIGVGVRAFLTKAANIKEDRHGKGGVSYDQKKVWLEEIIGPLKPAPEFKDAAWPESHQCIISTVQRHLKKNDHLWTPGKEQAEPAPAGSEGTKDEELTEFQQAHLFLLAHPPPPLSTS